MHAPMWSMLLSVPGFCEGHTFTILCLCSLFYTNPVYVKFLLNKHWWVRWGVNEVHWDNPNVICPFLNVSQGFYYLD